MSETLDNVNAEAPKRPVFLTVICILSFVGIGFAIIGYAGAFALLGAVEGVASGMSDALRDAGGTVTEGPSTGVIWAYIIGGFIMAIVELIGVIQMWKLKKSGFYMYTVAAVISIVLGILFGGFGAGVIFPIAFIVMYALNLKAMK